MNPYHARDILTAFLNGETVQVREGYTPWLDVSKDHKFDFADFEYRIKPKPEKLKLTIPLRIELDFRLASAPATNPFKPGDIVHGANYWLMNGRRIQITNSEYTAEGGVTHSGYFLDKRGSYDGVVPVKWGRDGLPIDSVHQIHDETLIDFSMLPYTIFKRLPL